MITKIFVVTNTNWDNFEPNYAYPYFYYTEADAIKNAKARAVIFNEPDWKELFNVETFLLGEQQ